VPQIKFYKYTNEKNGHFAMCIRLQAQQKQFSQTQIHERTAANKKTLHPSFVYLCIHLQAKEITALWTAQAAQIVLRRFCALCKDGAKLYFCAVFALFVFFVGIHIFYRQSRRLLKWGWRQSEAEKGEIKP
jgi:hypothetical protein